MKCEVYSVQCSVFSVQCVVYIEAYSVVLSMSCGSVVLLSVECAVQCPVSCC